MQIDYDLPSVTLPEASDPAAMQIKYVEELREYRKEAKGSLAQILELWDIVQCSWSWVENGGGSTAINAYSNAKRMVEKHVVREGLPWVEYGKEAMLLKNATRPRPGGGTGYYSPSVCQRIIETGGAEWKP